MGELKGIEQRKSPVFRFNPISSARRRPNVHNLTYVKKINYIRLDKKTPNRAGASKLGRCILELRKLVLGKLGRDFCAGGELCRNLNDLFHPIVVQLIHIK